MSREKRFTSTQSDDSHAYLGCFADNLYSSDERFVKKAKAAYDYLNINTQIFENLDK